MLNYKTWIWEELCKKLLRKNENNYAVKNDKIYAKTYIMLDWPYYYKLNK